MVNFLSKGNCEANKKLSQIGELKKTALFFFFLSLLNLALMEIFVFWM